MSADHNAHPHPPSRHAFEVVLNARPLEPHKHRAEYLSGLTFSDSNKTAFGQWLRRKHPEAFEVLYQQFLHERNRPQSRGSQGGKSATT